MKTDYLSRMYEEYNQLKELLISQKEHMKAYREVLNKRINYTKQKYSDL